MSARYAVLLLPLLFVGGTGCGGGVDLTNPTRISGSLDERDSRFSDGSLADFYVASAARSGRAQIEMKPDRFDAYLIVSARNSAGEIENIIEDSGSSGDRTAKVIFDVRKGQTYFIAAVDNSASLDPGPYSIIFSDILTNVRVNPDSRSTRVRPATIPQN
jgi:hypothetical protein